MRGEGPPSRRVLAIVLVACDPIPHPNFTSKAGPSSPVTFELLSGDARFAVVRSTAAFATIPGAGRFRVNRSDDSVVSLPTTGAAQAISDDGSRVLVGSNPPAVWSSGTVLSAPPGALCSDDLTFAVFEDAADGRIKTWQTSTQSVGEVETGFARPAGTVNAVPKAVADDGRTVEYELQGPQHLERFVDLDANQKFDVANQTVVGDAFVDELFALAPNGAGFVHAHNVGHEEETGTAIEESWAELVSLPAGTAGRRYVNSTGERITTVRAAANAAWLYQQAKSLLPDSACGDPPGPFECDVSSHALLLRRDGARTFDTGDGPIRASDMSRDGRFFVLTKTRFPAAVVGFDGPVTVLDWLSGNVETVTDGVDYTEQSSLACQRVGKSAPCTMRAMSKNGMISDDGRTIATTTHTDKGWYEYVADPPSSPT